VNDSNGNNGSPPPEPGDTPEWVPTADQPWRPLPDDGADTPYVYDYGSPWCADRLDHPQFQHGGYPGVNHHLSECQSYGGASEGRFGDGGGGLDGPAGVLAIYLVRPFRFGQRRTRTVDEDRLVLECAPLDDDGQPFRFSLPSFMIRSIAAHLAQTAGVADGWRPPRHVRQSMTD
jgi:hypothetical protein